MSATDLRGRFIVRTDGPADDWVVAEIIDQNCYLKDFLLDYIPADGLVLDIGAHIGVFSVLAAERLRPRQVLAFEPEAENYSYLQQNIARNNFIGRIEPIAIGLWSEEGQLPLHLEAENSGGHSLFKAKAELETTRPSYQEQVVEVTTLDHWLEARNLGAEPISLLKIDTEGAEGQILRGGQAALARTEVVVGELHQALVKRPQLLELLNEFEVWVSEPFGALATSTFWAIRRSRLDPQGLALFRQQAHVGSLEDSNWHLKYSSEALRVQLEATQDKLSKALLWEREKEANAQAEIASLQQHLASKELELDELKNWVAQKEAVTVQAQIASLHQHLAAKELELNSMQDWRANKEEQDHRWQTDLTEALAAKTQELQDIQDLMASKEAETSRAFAGLQEALRQKEAEIAALLAIVHDYKEALASKEQDLIAFLASNETTKQ